MINNSLENSSFDDDLNELRIINNLVNKISGIRETNHIMDVIASKLIRITESDQGIISLISSSHKDSLSTVVRADKQSQSSIPFKVSNFISGWVLKERKMLIIDDLDNDERFRGINSDNGRHKYILCYPMIVRGEIIGLVTLIRSGKKEPFKSNQCRLVGILASQSAQILANAVLLEELAKTVELLKISQQKLKEENIRLKRDITANFGFENIICKSPNMKKVMTLASKFSLNDSAVLITGETGTGKELVAKAIHYNSSRKDKPLIVVNCGSFKSESLLESELFGHVKGAFTGAITNKIGLFKEADSGTIFLDEIGDASISTQAAILRVIQNGEIRPVGSTKTEIIDVRVISATNKKLNEEISKNNFREDLYYRLNTFMIELPALRERKIDIPLLVKYFLNKLKIKQNMDELSISPNALELLMKYSWPGNVRQLEHEIERAVVVHSNDGLVEARDLSPKLFTIDIDYSSLNSYKGHLREIIEKIETNIIKSTLTEYKGNILQTSRVLGLTRKGLKDKMTRYKIAYHDNQD